MQSEIGKRPGRCLVAFKVKKDSRTVLNHGSGISFAHIKLLRYSIPVVDLTTNFLGFNWKLLLYLCFGIAYFYVL